MKWSISTFRERESEAIIPGISREGEREWKEKTKWLDNLKKDIFRNYLTWEGVLGFGPKYSQPYRSPFLLIPPLLVIVAIIDNNDLIRIFTFTDTFAALHDPCPPYLGLSPKSYHFFEASERTHRQGADHFGILQLLGRSRKSWYIIIVIFAFGQINMQKKGQ